MNLNGPEIPLSRPMRRGWLNSDERSTVYRRGDIVIRETGPWASSVHSFLRHLESAGFEGAPKVVGDGFAEDGRETLSFIQGEVINPTPWNAEGIETLGRMIRELHDASASFSPEEDTLWRPFFGRDLGGPDRIISHCDISPWNVVSVDGLPAGLIDWEYAGAVDPRVELAQAGWLNIRLFSDDIANVEKLPPVEQRAEHLRMFIDAYGLADSDRKNFLNLIVDFVMCDTAYQADEAGITKESDDPEPLWGLTWRARSGAWLVRNREIFERAIQG
jgi:hypothetical protein